MSSIPWNDQPDTRYQVHKFRGDSIHLAPHIHAQLHLHVTGRCNPFSFITNFDSVDYCDCTILYDMMTWHFIVQLYNALVHENQNTNSLCFKLRCFYYDIEFGWVPNPLFSMHVLLTSSNISYLTITNWRLLSSLHMKPPRISCGHSKKIENSYKFSQKSETSSHQSNNSNYNNHRICYLF